MPTAVSTSIRLCLPERVSALPTQASRQARSSTFASRVAVALLSGLALLLSLPGTSGPASASTPVDPPEANAAQCPEGDHACQERMHELAETLFIYEAGVTTVIGPAAAGCWQDDVEAFQRTLTLCPDLACREGSIKQRLASLHDLQRQEFRTRMTLPEAPALVAMLGPEEEVVAGEPALPLSKEGALVYATRHPEHMGIAVQVDGQDHVIVFDMDRGNQAGHDELQALVGTSPTAQVRVSGFRLDAPDGTPNFNPARCRIVYQLPW